MIMYTLANDAVHIWQVFLKPFAESPQRAELFELLTEEERARASRYVYTVDQDRFIIARGVLRALLGRYLGIDPRTIVFEYGEHGKPSVMSSLKFNLSHAGDWAVYGFTQRQNIGIDVERMRDDLDINSIAQRFFSAYESSMLQQLPPEQQLAAFFDIWAKKEAFIKAIGSGLFYSLQQFDVSVNPMEPATLLSVAGSQEKAQAWVLQTFTPAAGYAGAWAIEGAVEQVQYNAILDVMSLGDIL
jgi:4'-phosphopantetheinyl transferase